MKEYELHTLPNGLRLAHKQVSHTKVAHCGFILDIGSRDELPHQQGMAHFWEHMAFKGTQKRRAYHILSRLEDYGGDLNAYTTKEKICFHASVLQDYFGQAFELLADITFHSVFPEKEIHKERTVILEEMSMYQDDPGEAIFDDFDELLFAGHPLGKNILGTTASVGSFNRQNFLEFVKNNLHTQRMVLASVGPMPFSKVLALAQRYVSEVPATQATLLRQPFTTYQPRQQAASRVAINQAHCILGGPAYGLTDERRLPFYMLNNLLGGPGMNSRLNLTLREKYGLVYAVESSYNIYLDTGNFSVYFATEKRNLERCLSLTYKELDRLKEPLGTLQLQRAKQQLMGQLAMAEESNLGFMLMMGKSLLDTGEVETLADIFKQIEAITAPQLAEVAREVFAQPQLSQLVYHPA
ncbi:MAG: insulinase family protein [Bernardetiaceae bacterium]|jgi:predicted Zn-dependent peptidase|nr:insulinase family protein [Bernardetiaceae bacterium]